MSNPISASFERIITKIIKEVAQEFKLDVKKLTALANSIKIKPSKSNRGGSCSEIKKTGKKCDKKEHKDGLCKAHWTAKNKSKDKTKTTKKSSAASKEMNNPIIEKIHNQVPTLSLRKNQYNNFEHPQTHFVFDKATHHVIGKQADDKIIPLSKEDIDICKSYSFKYEIPLSLSSSKDDKKEDEEELSDEEEDEGEVEVVD